MAQLSIQEIINKLAGTEGLSEVEALCSYFGYKPATEYTVQHILNLRLGNKPTNRYSVQELLFNSLKGGLSLDGTAIDYSEQDLWNKANEAGYTLLDICGGASVSPSVSPSRSPSASASRSPSRSPSASASRSPSRSPSASASTSPSPSASPSLSPSASESLSPSASESVSPSSSESA